MKAYLQNIASQEEYIIHSGTKIGRSEACDVVIPDPSVSREHATLLLEEDSEWYIVDNNTTNGTLLDGDQLISGVKYRLKNGTFIQLGNVHLRIMIEREPNNKTTLLVDTPDDEPLSGNDFADGATVARKPYRPQPVEQKPEQPRPVERKPEQARPVEWKPEQPGSAEWKPEQPGSAEWKPEQPKPVEKKKCSPLKKIFLIAGAGLLAIAMAILVWCIVWKSVGNKYFNESDFSRAESALSKDFLHGGRKLADSIHEAESNYAAGSYLTASRYYESFGEPGQEKWKECILLYSAESYKRGDYERAATYAEKAGDSGKEIWTKSIVALGEEAFQKGDYTNALAYFEQAGEAGEDGWKAVQIALGDDAYAAGDYAAAMEYYRKAGDAAKEKLADAIYAEGVKLISENKPEDALKCLNEIKEEERAKQQIGVAEMMLVRELYDKGLYSDAIEKVTSIEDTTLLDVDSFLSDVYYQYGMQLFKKSKYAEAMEAFQKTDHPSAAANVEIIELFLNGDYYQAATAAIRYTEENQTEINFSAWKSMIRTKTNMYSQTDLDQNIRYGCVEVLLADRNNEDARKLYFTRNVPSGEFIGSFEKTDSDYFIIQSLDELYNNAYGTIGAKPDGKVLIVICRAIGPWEDKDTARPYAISFKLMQYLPKELYPTSLEDVEYIVLMTYDKTKTGYYDYNKLDAYKEFAKVEVFKLPGRGKIHSSSTVYGDNPPTWISYSMSNPPKYKSGGAPDMSDALYKAIQKLRH